MTFSICNRFPGVYVSTSEIPKSHPLRVVFPSFETRTDKPNIGTESSTGFSKFGISVAWWYDLILSVVSRKVKTG